MSGRKALLIKFLSTAFLAWFLYILASMSGSVQSPSAPESASSRFAPTPCPLSPILSAIPVPAAVLEECPLPYEIEEQERADAADEPQIAFLVPCSILKVPVRQFRRHREIPSLYPMRC